GLSIFFGRSVTLLTDGPMKVRLASNTCSTGERNERASVRHRGASGRGHQYGVRRAAGSRLRRAAAGRPDARRGAPQEAVGDTPPPIASSGRLSLNGPLARRPA